MSEKIDVNRHSPAFMFLIQAICQKWPDGAPPDFPHEPDTPIEVEFRVNGVELPFAAVVADLHARYQMQIAEQAAELVESKAGLSDFMGKMTNLQDTMMYELRDLIRTHLSVDTDENGNWHSK